MGTRECDAEIRRGRMRKASGFFDAAVNASTVDAAGASNDAVVTLYVHAGIAAADVICCARLGRHSSGESHVDAAGLLKTVSASHARHLSTLLGMKTKAGYSHRPATESEVKRAGRAAEHLIDAARDANAG